MADFEDLKLDKTPSLVPTPPPSRLLPGIIIAILLIGLAGGWYYLHRQRALEGPVTVRDEQIVPQTSVPADAAQLDVPPLDESDDLVRELLAALSRHPIVTAWLTTDQLIRTFAVSVMNVADGETPAGHLYTIKPETRFQTRQRGETLFVDPAGYSRFDGHAAAIASIDPGGAAQLYNRLKPRIEEAYREVAGANADFDGTLQRAIAELLATPVVEGEIAVERHTVGYGYVDPSLESLSRAQQQLLRMGPQNVRVVQQQLRAIAQRLGIDESALPRERVVRSRR